MAPREGFRPAGGTGSVSLLESLDGVVTSIGAVAREIQESTRSVNVTQQATMTYLRNDLPRQLSNEVTRAVTAAGDALTSQISGSASAGPPAPPTRDQRWREGFTPSPASTGRVPTTSEIRNRERAPEEPTFIQQMGAQGSRYRLSDLRRGVAGSIERHLSDIHWGQQLEPGPEGGWYPQGTVAWRQQAAAAGVPASAMDAAAPEASEGAVRAFQARNAIVGGVKEIAGRMAGGAGLGEALTGAFPKTLGVVGAGIGLARQGLSMAENQRQANAGWQRITGESNASAFGERARSQLFEMSQMGFMGAGQASELYQGTRALGLTGNTRTLAQQFGLDMYRDFGMPVRESLEIVRTAAESGQQSLTGVADALKSVTATARETGQNADVMRQRFETNFKQVSNIIGATGGQAPLVAAGLTNAQTQLGPRFADADFSGALGTQQLRMYARQRGMALGPYLTAAERPGGANMLTGDMRQFMTRIIQGRVGRQGMDMVRDFVQQAGNNPNNLTSEQWERLGQQLRTLPGMDPEAMQSIIQQMTGIDIQANDTGQFAADVLTGKWDPQGEARKAERNRQRQFVGRGGPDSNATSLTGGLRSAAEAIGWDTQDTSFDRKTRLPFRENEQGNSEALYMSQISQTGFRNPQIENLLNQRDGAWRFKVDVTDDKGRKSQRVVTLDDAIRHFSDQLQSGKAEIVAGRGAGSTVGELTGLGADTTVKVTSDDKGAANSKLKAGTDASKWEKEHAGDEGKTTHVLVSPTPELARFFNFDITSNGAKDSARVNGTTPKSYVPPSQRATG